jgi:hypothetical protein
MDRLDRAERFGYRRPSGSFDRPPVVYRPHPAPCADPPVQTYPYVH